MFVGGEKCSGNFADVTSCDSAFGGMQLRPSREKKVMCLRKTFGHRQQNRFCCNDRTAVDGGNTHRLVSSHGDFISALLSSPTFTHI